LKTEKLRCCECGCGSIVKNRFISGHNHPRHTKEFKQKLSERQQGENNVAKRPEVRERIRLAKKGRKNLKCSETKKKLHRKGKLKIWNKGLTTKTDERIKKMGEKISNSKRGKKNLKYSENLQEKRKSPQYDKWYKNSRFKGAFKKWKEKNPENFLIHQSRAGICSIKSIRKNKPYWFNGVPFDSKMERECAIKLLKMGFLKHLIEGVTCHKTVGSKEFDFFNKIFNKEIFIEYHPYDRKFSLQEYYKNRKKILNENGYENSLFFVIASLKEYHLKEEYFNSLLKM
jgi:hypothetical protein